MAYHNKFLYTNDDGDYQSRQIQYAIPIVDTAVYTVFKERELPELVFDVSGEMLFDIVKHEDM